MDLKSSKLLLKEQFSLIVKNYKKCILLDGDNYPGNYLYYSYGEDKFPENVILKERAKFSEKNLAKIAILEPGICLEFKILLRK